MIDKYFWDNTIKSNGCWAWLGPKQTAGYGRIHRHGHDVLAHRFSYELNIGAIPTGLDIDHRCHDPKLCSGGRDCPHRMCVNPDHLKAVTRGENLSADRGNHSNRGRTSCRKGHEYSEENTYRYRDGRRDCRTCMRIRGRENMQLRRKRLKDEASAKGCPGR